MILIKNDEVLCKILCDSSFYGRFSYPELFITYFGDLNVGEEALGIMLLNNKVQGVLMDKEYIKERKQEREAEKEELKKELNVIKEYLANYLS